MKSEKISDAIGLIDDELIAAAEKSRRQRKRKKRYLVRLMAVAACICLTVIGISEKMKPMEVLAIASAKYPEMALYPEREKFVDEETGELDKEAFEKACAVWLEDRQKQLDWPKEYKDGLDQFVSQTARQFLTDADSENCVYSPLNIYMALGILAELTDGNSREQILDVLGTEDIDSLRERALALWNANYSDDGVIRSLLANSLWLNEDIDFSQSVMDTLAENYYASSYQGTMGSEDFNASLQEWMNEQTGGLLEEYTKGTELEYRTVLALVSTVSFQAKWLTEFDPVKTEEGIFHSAGGDLICDFMKQDMEETYSWGEKFSAVKLYLKNTGCVQFILPNEGTTVEELLGDDEVKEFYMAENKWEHSKFMTIHLSMPKFNISSELDLTDGLRALGITDVFDDKIADFSSMTSAEDPIFLSKADHAVRVMVDEEGCTAAASTVMRTEMGAGGAEEEIDFVLDRPFLFVITGLDGVPLFIGAVNQPVS